MNEREIYASAKLILQQDTTRGALLEQYQSLKKTELEMDRSKKLLAEICFLLAKDFLSQGEEEKARTFGKESVELYNGLVIESLEQAVPELSDYLPEIMHEGVVKKHLADILGD